MRQIPQPVLDTLARGGVVLCANARAARALGGLYARHAQAEHGREAWETPRIHDWRQWLHAQWRELLLTGTEERTLLTPLQEQVLWNEAVLPSVEGRSLIAPAEGARLAMRAYALLCDYGAAVRLHRAADWDHAGEEPALFRKWALALERRCERGRWLCEARLPWALAEAWRDGRLPGPPVIAWNGFDRLTPVDQAVRNALGEAGCDPIEVTWQLSAERRLLAAPGTRGELEACAHWARAILDEQPHAEIGILCPDVESIRAEADSVLGRVLGNGRARQPLHEFTLGLPLAETPMVAAALALLEWCTQPQEQTTITWLLTSGFFGAARDAATLAEADIKVRKRLTVPELEMEDALERLSKFSGATGGNWAVANWVARMRRALAVLQPLRGKQRLCGQWVATIGAVLQEAGWPGDRVLDSVGYQVRDRWHRALEEVSKLSIEERRYDYAEFLRLLASHLRASIFSAESTGAPVTVSGILESSGRSFEAVWVLGVTDDAWPARSRPQPMLPLWLQKDLAMPGSSAEQDRALAATVFERLRDSTGELSFSYAREGKEGEQRPSALLVHLDEEPLASAASADELRVEPFVDEMAVPWPGGRSAGGQEVLKKQSACPFQAFAAKRLGARELPSFEAGLNAADRGSLVHDILAAVWMDARMRDRNGLQTAIMNAELAAIVELHITAVFTKYEEAATTEWERGYLHLERERLASLLTQWLLHEARREDFEVEQCEAKEPILVDGLELSVRMDRVDRVKNGRLLIDYKTGKVDAGKWWGARPDEPQLPLYAISGKIDSLRDVLFAQVRADGTMFVSAVDGKNPSIFPGNTRRADAEEYFLEMRACWAETLDTLSREFQQGSATVTPKDFPATCQYCEFGGLCRVAESRTESFEQNEEEA